MPCNPLRDSIDKNEISGIYSCLGHIISTILDKEVKTCGICNKTYDDPLDKQEFTHIFRRCGYASKIGDYKQIELTMCEDCLVEKLGKYLKVTDLTEPLGAP